MFLERAHPALLYTIVLVIKKELQRRFSEDFLGGFCKESIIDGEPVSIVNYTRSGSSIKQHTPK